MVWKVIETKNAAKELLRLPKKIRLIYVELVSDLEREGPFPYGWDIVPMKDSDKIRIRLTREYRVLAEIVRPNILIIRVAHRGEVYK
jgi:mRNA-degrading endonuclease RelE of RelBE toxin-antitoxin system